MGVDGVGDFLPPELGDDHVETCEHGFYSYVALRWHFFSEPEAVLACAFPDGFRHVFAWEFGEGAVSAYEAC